MAAAGLACCHALETTAMVIPKSLSSHTNRQTCCDTVVEDADVAAERQRVLQAAAAGGRQDIISIANLRKQYDDTSGKVGEACAPCPGFGA